MQYPLKEYRLGLLFNAPYGSVLSKLLGARHKGVDLLPLGDYNIYPMADGVITLAVMGKGFCGGQVDIQYSNGIKSRYCHMRILDVKTGNKVNSAQVVGVMGSTGLSRPRGLVHVHWVTWKNGLLVDPISLVEDVGDLMNQVNALFRSVWGRQPLPKESHYFQKRVVDGINEAGDLMDKMDYWKAQSRFRFIWEMQKAGFF